MNIYVTFGQIHVHSINGKTFDKDCIAMFQAKNIQEGCKQAFEYFGNKFFSVYPSKKITSKFLSYFPRGIIEL